jgi:L-histidine N-alpha-methyltransferase
VQPEVADLSTAFQLRAGLERPLLAALLGSTIGNFPPEPAARLLERVRAMLGPDDAFLMGADLRPGEGKSEAELVAAYDDAQGVTAAFNRNMLHVLNREAGTDFDAAGFEHQALYRRDEGRIEMHLVARAPMTVRVPGRGDLRMELGESIRTEISCKYDRTTVERLFAAAGLAVRDWATDPHGRYALVLGGAA